MKILLAVIITSFTVSCGENSAKSNRTLDKSDEAGMTEQEGSNLFGAVLFAKKVAELENLKNTSYKTYFNKICTEYKYKSNNICNKGEDYIIQSTGDGKAASLKEYRDYYEREEGRRQVKCNNKLVLDDIFLGSNYNYIKKSDIELFRGKCKVYDMSDNHLGFVSLEIGGFVMNPKITLVVSDS